MEITSSIPRGWKPRDIQVELLNRIQEGIESGKEYFFIDAPTGSGKSLINMTVANHMGSAYIMTPLKILQTQYMDDFGDILVELRGRSNYRCPDGEPCNHGLCMSTDKKVSELDCYHECPWKIAIKEAEESPLTLFNFYSYICQNKYANRFQDARGAMIVDEAHNLVDILRGFFDIIIKANSIEAKAIGFPEAETLSELVSWVNIEGLEKAKRLSELAPEDDEENEFKQIYFKLNELSKDPRNYVMGRDGDKYTIRRKKVGDFFNECISPSGTIKIFSSATLFNYDTICDYLSIPMDKVAYIQAPWPMSKEQGPICLSLAKIGVTHKSLSDPTTIRKLINNLELVTNELHPLDKGIIHTVSNNLRDLILEGCSRGLRSRLTSDLEEFHEMERGILIGASFFEGLDMPDDLCRFQVLMKIPIPSILDPLVKFLGYEHQEIKDRVVTSIAQGYGRGIRNSEDYCTFYILDSMIRYWKDRFPSYLKEAII